jgi:tetratricopeptide (TPR) repeat protein
MSLAMLAAELRDAGRRLAALDAGENVSVEAAFSWSYDHLPESGRRMFRLLGLLPGPDISAAAAASLARADPGQARRLLGQLAEASLLTENAPGRFRCHDLLRGYAAERARAEDSQPDRRAAIHRALGHYLHSAHAADGMLRKFPATITLGSPQPGVVAELPGDFQQAMAWFDAEQRVLVPLVDHAVSAGFDEHGWQLAVTLATFFDRKGHVDTPLKTLHAALAPAQRVGGHQAQAHVHRRIGGILARIGEYQDAESHFQQALDLCREAGDPAGQALAHLGLGFAADEDGRYHDALTHAFRALSLSRLIDDRALKAVAVSNLGWCHARLGSYRHALACAQHAISMHQEVGDRYHQAYALLGLGYAESHLGQHTKAIGSYRQALALFRQIGARVNQAITMGYLGDAHEADGKPQLAAQAWQQSLTILEELDHHQAGEIRGKLDRTQAAGHGLPRRAAKH